jgi:uncharacterized Tic20 family protein
MPADPTTACSIRRGWPRWVRLFVAASALVAAPFATSTRSVEAGHSAAAPGEALRAGAGVFVGEIDSIAMAPQTALSDPDLAAGIASIKSGFATTVAPPNDTTSVSSDESWSFMRYVYLAAVGLALGLFLVLLGPRVIAVRDRREMTWLDAWAKSAVIVVSIIVGVVYVPAKVLELGTVQDMSRAAQDLITVGLWSGALALTLLALWYAHRERRI